MIVLGDRSKGGSWLKVRGFIGKQQKKDFLSSIKRKEVEDNGEGAEDGGRKKLRQDLTIRFQTQENTAEVVEQPRPSQ